MNHFNGLLIELNRFNKLKNFRQLLFLLEPNSTSVRPLRTLRMGRLLMFRVDHRREIEYEDASQFADHFKWQYIEVSAALPSVKTLVN